MSRHFLAASDARLADQRTANRSQRPAGPTTFIRGALLCFFLLFLLGTVWVFASGGFQLVMR